MYGIFTYIYHKILPNVVTVGKNILVPLSVWDEEF